MLQGSAIVLLETSKVGRQGRVYLPESVRQAIDIREGDIVIFRIKHDAIIIEKLK